jgi:hypothetical protein
VSSVRPLLLVDVDGVISLFGFDQGAPPPGCPTVVDGIPHWLSHRAARNLDRLRDAFDCVWCTGWEERANEHLPHLLGLPGPFPYLLFGGPKSDRHWKLDAIDEHAGDTRPLAWIDDDLDSRCSDWAAARPGPTLLVRTHPAVGLADAHADDLLAWAKALESRP